MQFCLVGYIVFIKYWNQYLNKDSVIWIAQQLNIKVKLVQKHVDGLQGVFDLFPRVL